MNFKVGDYVTSTHHHNDFRKDVYQLGIIVLKESSYCTIMWLICKDSKPSKVWSDCYLERTNMWSYD